MLQVMERNAEFEFVPTFKQTVNHLVMSYPGHSVGIIFIHAKPLGRTWEAELRSTLEREQIPFELMNAEAQNVIAVMLPRVTLDQTHYYALMLKSVVEERLAGTPIVCAVAAVADSQEAEDIILGRWNDWPAADSSHIRVLHDHLQLEGAKRILVVDHDASVREFLNIWLTSQGYEVHEAEDALTALDVIHEGQFDLILTELNLYGINGLPFISQIQKMNLEKQPKIVILSEQRVGKTIDYCFEQGVSDYITKPFSPVELDERLSRCLS